VRGVRGTYILASRDRVRATGRFDEYDAALSNAERARMAEVLPACWVPMDLAHAHFRAVDALHIGEAAVLDGARSVAEKLNGVFLGTLVKTARLAGFTPWAGFTMASKLWHRIFDGGAVGVQEAGPKDARIVLVGNELFRHPYHRVAVRGHIRETTQVLVGSAHAREESCDLERGELRLLVSWV
jgi:hypothetical protein